MERRKEIESIIEKLDNISENYNVFEIALLIFLRSDLFTFKNYIVDSQIDELEELIDNYDSLLDIGKENVDYILKTEED